MSFASNDYLGLTTHPAVVGAAKAALDRWGTLSLQDALRGATRVARKGFVVDQTFVDQTAANAERFAAFTPTAELFLPGGAPPAVGSRFRNRDLAETYELLARAAGLPEG